MAIQPALANFSHGSIDISNKISFDVFFSAFVFKCPLFSSAHYFHVPMFLLCYCYATSILNQI